MSSNSAVRFYPETIRLRIAANISSTYAPIGAATSSASNNQYALLNPARQFILQNFTDVVLTYSWDGINDVMQLAAGTSFVDDVSSNQSSQGGAFSMAQGQIIYVKGSPTTGQTNLSIFYGAS